MPLSNEQLLEEIHDLELRLHKLEDSLPSQVRAFTSLDILHQQIEKLAVRIGDSSNNTHAKTVNLSQAVTNLSQACVNLAGEIEILHGLAGE